MNNKIEVTFDALTDIDEYASLIKIDSPSRASNWVRDTFELIFSLESMPRRFPIFDQVVFESGREVRYVVHNSHLVFFEINDGSECIFILRVWNGNREYPGEIDLP